MRLFVAILFSSDVVDKLEALQDELKSYAVSSSLVPRTNLHLTLEFLGECDEMKRDAAIEAIEKTESQPFRIKIDRVGFFSRPDGDIWWVGAESSNELITLHTLLYNELEKRGFSLERRKYKPHITLMRRSFIRFKATRIRAIEADVSSITLMQSERGNGRMIYTPLFKRLL